VSKQPKTKSLPAPGKSVPFSQAIESLKAPKTASNPQDYWSRHPAWRLHQIQMADPWGWHTLTNAEVAFIREKLAFLEQKSWSDILIVAKKQNHLVPVNNLCSKAQARLRALNINVDELLSLRLGSKERIYGILDQGVMSVLWWDPVHEVYPVEKKHT
jgi:hypothetical protein